MKYFHLACITILGTVVILLAACQPAGENQVSCEPASNPFTHLPDFEYNGGYYPNITITRVCKFSGQVRRGQFFKQEVIPDLVFCLRPNGQGWTIVMTDLADDNCEVNFSGLVSPPFHGVNPIFIDSLQFTDMDEESSHPDSFGTRGFNFVFNRVDYEARHNEYYCTMNNINCPPETGTGERRVIPHSRGIMTITDIRVWNPVLEEEIWIDDMEFEVDIYLPAE
ncbi:MAG: hypothetical protein JXB38_14545 [Anaerolineales bacterium]|nr:hypothetical protein [Anaerolineales bacterium]